MLYFVICVVLHMVAICCIRMSIMKETTVCILQSFQVGNFCSQSTKGHSQGTFVVVCLQILYTSSYTDIIGHGLYIGGEWVGQGQVYHKVPLIIIVLNILLLPFDNDIFYIDNCIQTFYSHFHHQQESSGHPMPLQSKNCYKLKLVN